MKSWFIIGLCLALGFNALSYPFNTYGPSCDTDTLINKSFYPHEQNTLAPVHTLPSPLKDGEVYICKGSNSKRYHFNKNCRGLRNCTTRLYNVSIKEAKRMGRTLCGYED